MINGILKLFYTEIVKNKIKDLPKDEYEIKDGFKKVQYISCKVDSISFKILKCFIVFLILILSLKVNIYFGIVMFFVEFFYIIYKKSFKTKLEKEVINIKNNIKTSSKNVLTENSKRNIPILICILFLGLTFGFTWAIKISLFIVFTYTIQDIYINYKN